MLNMTFQRVSLLVILLSFWLLSKGCQNYQSTTMLHNECTNTFLYVFGHCVENEDNKPCAKCTTPLLMQIALKEFC